MPLLVFVTNQKQSQSGTFDAASFLRKPGFGAISGAAVIKKPQPKTYTVNATLRKKASLSFSASSIIGSFSALPGEFSMVRIIPPEAIFIEISPPISILVQRVVVDISP